MQKQIEENKNNKIKKGDNQTRKINSLADKKEKLEKQLINSQEEVLNFFIFKKVFLFFVSIAR